MSKANFTTPYFSGAAFFRLHAHTTNVVLLPVTVPARRTYELTIGYSTAGSEQERRAQIPGGGVGRVNDGPWQPVVYPPTQFRDMIRQTTVTVELPAGTSTITLSKQDQPGIVDLDYVDVELKH